MKRFLRLLAKILRLFLSFELLWNNLKEVVEDSGIEPLTSCLQGRRSPI